MKRPRDPFEGVLIRARGHAGPAAVSGGGFNVLNQVNLGQPTTTLNAAANFGRITSAGSPRIVQFGLKYLY
jgi:hypothetical protein